MSFLNDLKKEADDKIRKAEEQSENSQISKQDKENLLAKVVLIKNYYSELAKNLNVLLPDEENDFILTKEVVFKKVKKANYVIKHKNKFEKESLFFRFEQIAPKKARVNLKTIHAAEKFRTLLKRNEIDYVEKMESDSRIIFTIEPKFIAKFDYLADLNRGFIELKISNFNEIWAQSIRYSPDKITDHLLDETAKYILGQENKFKEMSGGGISDTMRTKIQQNLRKDKEEKVNSEEETSRTKFGSTASKLKKFLKK